MKFSRGEGDFLGAEGVIPLNFPGGRPLNFTERGLGRFSGGRPQSPPPIKRHWVTLNFINVNHMNTLNVK